MFAPALHARFGDFFKILNKAAPFVYALVFHGRFSFSGRLTSVYSILYHTAYKNKENIYEANKEDATIAGTDGGY
jgi:hypothetical protein